MASPWPKDPSERVNKIPPRRGEWIDLPSPYLDEPVIPELPPMRPGCEPSEWSEQAWAKWEVWRHEPVTTYWSQSDIDFALETLQIYDDAYYTRASIMGCAAEIRHRETFLALNPKGKRDLRFRITFGVGKEATKNKPVPEQEAEVTQLDERRTRLGHGA